MGLIHCVHLFQIQFLSRARPTPKPLPFFTFFFFVLPGQTPLPVCVYLKRAQQSDHLNAITLLLFITRLCSTWRLAHLLLLLFGTVFARFMCLISLSLVKEFHICRVIFLFGDVFCENESGKVMASNFLFLLQFLVRTHKISFDRHLYILFIQVFQFKIISF